MALFGKAKRSTKKKGPRLDFTRVSNLEFDKEGRVEDFLDSQFTVEYDDGSFGYLFYRDENVTWKALNRGKRRLGSDGLGAFISPNYYDYVTFPDLTKWSTQTQANTATQTITVNVVPPTENDEIPEPVEEF